MIVGTGFGQQLRGPPSGLEDVVISTRADPTLTEIGPHALYGAAGVLEVFRTHRPMPRALSAALRHLRASRA